jgi:hypothetical protein
MTTQLRAAYDEAATLPAREQDALAALMLAELRDEQRWARSFAESETVLAALAAEALAEHRAGRTRPLDPDSLQDRAPMSVPGAHSKRCRA